MHKEKRKRTRVVFDTQVILKTDNSEITVAGDTRDISMKGIFIKSDQKISEKTPCQIEIRLFGTSSHLSIKIKGIITRQGKDGLGVGFDSMDPDSYFHLKNIVLYNALDPDAVEKEMFS